MPSRFRPKALAAALGLLIAASATVFAQAPRTADDVFRLSVARDGSGDLELHWQIDAGHYLYRDKMTARSGDGKTLRLATEAGDWKDDPTFGPTEIYHDTVAARVVAAELPPSGSIHVTYQGCAEQGICYPPVAKAVDPATLTITAEETGFPGDRASRPDSSAPLSLPSTAAAAETEDGLQSRLSGSVPVMLASFLGFGLLLALTPCVFPMIPILSGMLAHSGETLSASRGFVLSASYVLAMALAYASLGAAAAWTGQNLQIALQTPLALGLMSLVLVALALSMFGFYDLQIPAGWTGRLAGRAEGRNGSIGGAALLGFGSALIVGPCVTPPLAAALLFVAQTGDLVRGAGGLFALGFGMGLPLIAFGTFGAKLLPKAGRWLVKVKQAFGFIFIGLAISISSRAIPGEATILFWAGLSIACGVWLGMFRLTGRRPGRVVETTWPVLVGLTGMKMAAAAAILCGVMLVGAAAGSASDPMHLAAFLGGPSQGIPAAGFVRTVTTPAAFDAAMADARAEGRPILIDFTADWCTVCREIDRTVMTDPLVRSKLEKISLIRADVTTDTRESQLLMRRFGIVGPPTMLFLDPSSGREIADTRTIGTISVDVFLRKLGLTGTRAESQTSLPTGTTKGNQS